MLKLLSSFGNFCTKQGRDTKVIRRKLERFQHSNICWRKSYAINCNFEIIKIVGERNPYSIRTNCCNVKNLYVMCTHHIFVFRMFSRKNISPLKKINRYL
jgi:hypothetical protein